MVEQTKTYNFSLSADAHVAPYQCLVEDERVADIHATRELAKILLDQYGNQSLSLKKWRKVSPFRINWTDTTSKPPKARQSSLLRFDWFVDHIAKRRGLDHEALGLCSPEQSRWNWMDAHLTWWGHYAPCNQEPTSLPVQLQLALGPEFPVIPAIDREGFAISSPQLHLQQGLLRARLRVIQESSALVPQKIDRERGQQAQFIMGGTPPLAALMEFVSLYVSIVDITLMQAYYAGFYAPERTGLSFNKEIMGPATGRRISDKLKWVRALSGKDLHASVELDAFTQMKSVRNHLTHFDPPCFAASIDDVAGWLSKTSDVAWLLIKIRMCLGVPISGPLVQMAMAPPVVAVARDPAHQRHVQSADTGYLSSTWRGEHPHRGRDPLRVPERLVAELGRIRERTSNSLGQSFTIGDIVEAVLAQRVSELSSLDNSQFTSQLEAAMRQIKKI